MDLFEHACFSFSIRSFSRVVSSTSRPRRNLFGSRQRSVGDELPIDDASKVTLEASHGVLAALAGFTFPVEVFTCTAWCCSSCDLVEKRSSQSGHWSTSLIHNPL